METLMIIALIAVLIVFWLLSVQRELAVMDENVSNAMRQVGVQLSARFEALNALLNVTKGFVARDSQTLLETVKFRRVAITAQSAPEEVLRQEHVIAEALERISAAAEQNPQLKNDPHYTKYLGAVDGYEKMVRTSRLIYNDSVAKLNRATRLFPTCLIAGLMGFHQRDYLEAPEEPN